jgi:glutamine synthetase
LNDAVDLLEDSALARETLGDHVVEWFVRNKRAEWAAYKSEITQFELDRYLPTL